MSNLPPIIDISETGLKFLSGSSGDIGLGLALAATGLTAAPELALDSRCPELDCSLDRLLLSSSR